MALSDVVNVNANLTPGAIFNSVYTQTINGVSTPFTVSLSKSQVTAISGFADGVFVENEIPTAANFENFVNLMFTGNNGADAAAIISATEGNDAIMIALGAMSTVLKEFMFKYSIDVPQILYTFRNVNNIFSQL